MGGPFGDHPQVNAAGSTLSQEDQRSIGQGTGDPVYDSAGHTSYGKGPVEQARIFLNWLTAGGAPKPTDPGAIFTQSQATAPAAQDAARGQGFGGLFGTGSIIGEIAPPVQPIQPLQGLKPLNTSPLQPGVPYSVPAVPKVGGR